MWDGVLSIIDWKTSSRLKDKNHIENYFMQATAYSEMFEERTNMPIEQLVIAIAVEGETLPQIFIEKKQDYLTMTNRYIGKYHLTH